MSKAAPLHIPKADPTAGGFEFSKRPKSNAALRLKSTQGTLKKATNSSRSSIGAVEGGNRTMKSPQERDGHKVKEKRESQEQESPSTDDFNIVSQLPSQESGLLVATLSDEQIVESPTATLSVQTPLDENNPVETTSDAQETIVQGTPSLPASPFPVDGTDAPVTPLTSDGPDIVEDFDKYKYDVLTSGSTSPPTHRDADAETSPRETATNASSPTDTRLSLEFQSLFDLQDNADQDNANVEEPLQEYAPDPSEASMNGDPPSLLTPAEPKDELFIEGDDEHQPLCTTQEAVPGHSELYHVPHVMPPSVSPFSSSRYVKMKEISSEVNESKTLIQETDDEGVPLLLFGMPTEGKDASNFCLSSYLPEEVLESSHTTWLCDSTTSDFRLSASRTSFFALALDTNATDSILCWRVVPRAHSERFLDLCCQNATISTMKTVKVSEDELNTLVGEEIAVHECLQRPGQTVWIPSGCWYQTVMMNGTMELQITPAYTPASIFNAFQQDVYARHRSCTPGAPPYRRMIYGYLRLVQQDIEESGNSELNSDEWIHGTLVDYRPSRVLDAVLLFDQILVEEYTQGDRDHELHLNDPGFCDFCGTDIFHAAFVCSAKWGTSIGSDIPSTGCEVKLCPSCCAEGRACLCGNIRLCSVLDFEEILSMRNRIVSWCQSVLSSLPSSIKPLLTHEDLYEATDHIHLALGAIVIQNMRRSASSLDKNLPKESKIVICSGGSSRSDKHEILRIQGITCDTCNESICFPHILASGVHAAEAAYRWEEDRGWHHVHHKWVPRWKKWSQVFPSASKHPAEGIITLARALSQCRPIKAEALRLGFYDELAESVECARYEDYVDTDDVPTLDPDPTQMIIAPVNGINKGYKRKTDIVATDSPNIHAPKRRRKAKDPAFSLKRTGKGKKSTKGRKKPVDTLLIGSTPSDDINLIRRRALSANSSTSVDHDGGSEAPEDLLQRPTSSLAQSEMESDYETNVVRPTETFGNADLDLRRINVSLSSFGRTRPSLDTDTVINEGVPPPLTGDSAALSGLTTGATSPMTPGDHLYTYQHSPKNHNPSPTSAQRERLAGLSLEDYKSKWESEVENRRLLQQANAELEKEIGLLQRQIAGERNLHSEEIAHLREGTFRLENNMSTLFDDERQKLLQELNGFREIASQLETAVNRVQELSVRNEQLEEQNRHMQSMVEYTNKDNDRLLTEIASLRNHVRDMDRELHELRPIKQDFFRLQSQLQELSSAKERSQHLEAEVTALRSVQVRSQMLIAQADNLHRELQSEHNNRKKVEQDNDELRMNLSRMVSMEGRVFALEEQLAEARKEKNQMQMELDKHKKVLDQKNLELVRYRNRASGRNAPRKDSPSTASQTSREHSRGYSQTPSKRNSSKHSTSDDDADCDGEPDPIDLLGGRYGR